MNEWSEVDKAQWILENGVPEYVWIFERNGEQVYKRPCPADGKVLPPWMRDLPREPVLKKHTSDKEKWQWQWAK